MVPGARDPVRESLPTASSFLEPRRLRLVLVAIFLLAAGLLAFLVGRRAWSADHPSRGSADARSGCVVHASQYGYPDAYLTRRVPYVKHPPLPTAGWRGPSAHVGFAMLFHSLFHGYVVVRYRRDLPAPTMAVLRSWVRRHTRERVTAAPARAATPALDVAKWGHELRCTAASAIEVRTLDRFLRLHGSP
jgi:uncharacterized protein DUF3105